jgi:hypothetical protein
MLSSLMNAMTGIADEDANLANDNPALPAVRMQKACGRDDPASLMALRTTANDLRSLCVPRGLALSSFTQRCLIPK